VSSILSDAEWAAIAADLKSVADTFARPLKVYKEATHTVIVSDPNYNPFAPSNPGSADIQVTPNETVINGRITYDKLQDQAFVTPHGQSAAQGAQIKVKDQTSRAVRVKVDEAGYLVLKDAKRVDIDGELFFPASNPRKHGVPGAWYYTFYFTRDQ
jgi:hypothetical protein